MAKLIKVRSITLTRAEGRHGEVDKPITLHKGQHPDIWAAADKVLFGWSTTAPKEGGYHKCDFVVEYEDGEKYTGRFDLYHYSIEYPHLAEHMYDFVRFTSGKYKGALTQEEYDRFKEREHFKKLAPEFAKFLDKYEIGAYNLTRPKVDTRLQHRGKDTKAIKVAERLGLSFDGFQSDAAGKRRYQFTVQKGPLEAQGITFYVENLSEVEGRLKEKFKEFGLGKSAQTAGIKPKRDDVSVDSWVERDRIGIWVTNRRTQKTVAQWWDEEAHAMFEAGFFKPATFTSSGELGGPEFINSVLDYLVEMDVIEGEKPKVSSLPQTKGAYLGGWKPTDLAVYSDFGLRSLYIVQVIPWPEEKGERFHGKYVTHDRSMGSVRAKIVDTSLVDWDFEYAVLIPEYREVGSEHYYDYTNLYPDIHDLINRQARILRKDVLDKTVADLKKHPGWKQLEQRGLTGPGKLDLSKGKMREIPLTPKTSLQRAALQRLGEYKIIHEHDDGDLTVKVGDKQYIVATTGEVFVQTGHMARKGGNGHNDEEFQLKSIPSESLELPVSFTTKEQWEKWRANIIDSIYERDKGHRWTRAQLEGFSAWQLHNVDKFISHGVVKYDKQPQTEEPKRRPKQEGDLELIPDSPEFVAQTVQDSGWRERLDQEFNAAIERTSKRP